MIEMRRQEIVATRLATEKNSSFECPPNTVLVGRRHTGDENGPTEYYYCALKAYFNGRPLPNDVIVTNRTWWGWVRESGHQFGLASPWVMTGRQHLGDENGATRYQTGVIRVAGRIVPRLNLGGTPQAIKESAGTLVIAPRNDLLQGRQHWGDEHGRTFYGWGTYAIPRALDELDEFDVKVSDPPFVPEEIGFALGDTAAMVEDADGTLDPGEGLKRGKM